MKLKMRYLYIPPKIPKFESFGVLVEYIELYFSDDILNDKNIMKIISILPKLLLKTEKEGMFLNSFYETSTT